MFSRDLGIDLGTANLRIFQRGRGIVVREPSVVALSSHSKIPTAFGKDAREMIGRVPDSIEVVHPIRDGVIASYAVTEAMLRHYLNQLGVRRMLGKPRVVVCVPSNVTSVEKQAVLDACRAAGARDAYALEEPMAAALGLGLGIAEAQGHMVVDIGAGTCDVAVIALGGVVLSDTARVGGDNFEDAIARAIRREHSIVLSERAAEEVKIAVGSAFESDEEREIEMRGRNLVDGMPKAILVSSSEVRAALAEPVGQIVAKVRAILEQTPPELANDIANVGIWLSGGGAMLQGLDKLLESETGLRVHRSDDPMSSVINGLGRALEQVNEFAEAPGVLVSSKS